jgi:hypothetical protein
MNSKKAITLLVIITLLMAFVPIFPVRGFTGPPTLEDKDGAAITDGDYDDTVVVLGNEDDVPGGTTIELYWDDTTHGWDGESGLLNTTTADSDGSYEVWFDVPEAEYGEHTIWVKAGDEYESVDFDVLVKVDPDSSSGEGEDKVDVDVYGQDGNKDVAILFVADTAVLGWNWVAATTVTEDFDAGETEYDGSVPGDLIGPTTMVITDGVETFTDPLGDGDLVGDLGGEGEINYVTGEWEVEFNTAPAVDFTIDYLELIDLADDTELLGTGETNDVGSWSKRVEIPDWTPTGYNLATLDAKGNSGNDDFTIGAVLTATPDEVDVGDVITVKGRGYTPFGTVDNDDVTIGGIVAEIIDYEDPEDIDEDGDFSFKIVVPQMPDEDEDYDLVVTDSGALTADVEIEVEDLAKITITPDFGPQGATVSIEGVNFPNIRDEEIDIVLVGDPDVIEEFETESDGSFSGTFRVPAVADGDEEFRAYWDSEEGYDNVHDEADFRIGSILVLLSDDEGPAGLEVILSGNGFTGDGEWNATFGDEEIFEDEAVSTEGLLGANTFYVPQVEPGTYDITVWDEDSEIAVITEFVVTHATSFEMIPAEAPAGFNVTFEAMYWSEDQGETFEFVVWNETEDWDITDEVWKVSSDEDGIGPIPAPFSTGDDDGSEADDGAASMWWYIGDNDPEDAEEVFSKGTYWLNVTYGDDFEYTTSFVVGDPHARIAPRKSTFRIGDTLSFAIEHSFGDNPLGDIEDGNVDIFDPSGNLYFRTDELDTDLWVKSGMFYYVPISGQVDNENPMILLDDAPLGTWSFEWYEEGGEDLIASGTFEVAESTEALITGKIDDLNNQITDLQDTVSDVTSEFDDIRSDIAEVATIAEQAVSAANAVADAVQTVAQTANQANTAAENAAEAANAAKDAANSLTTLVYGAIGAALVAALAAIVSLMQISRRIAG